jgi:magnesium transporter
MSADYLTFAREARVADALREIRAGRHEHAAVSYVYVVNGDQKTLIGVVDLRDLVQAADDTQLGELLVAPVVSAERDDTREDLAEMFAKYHFRMIPVVDAQDHLLGVVHYHDIMKGLVTRAKV